MARDGILADIAAAALNISFSGNHRRGGCGCGCRSRLRNRARVNGRRVSRTNHQRAEASLIFVLHNAGKGALVDVAAAALDLRPRNGLADVRLNWKHLGLGDRLSDVCLNGEHLRRGSRDPDCRGIGRACRVGATAVDFLGVASTGDNALFGITAAAFSFKHRTCWHSRDEGNATSEDGCCEGEGAHSCG